MGFEFGGEAVSNQDIKISVVGVGGAGGNAIDNIIDGGVAGVNFITVNTDKQDLDGTKAETKLQIGEKLTGGLGAGNDPAKGKAAAEENYEDIKKFLSGSRMAFIVAGMGGGTGTGAAPIVAKAAREIGALTVGLITTPFSIEGKQKMRFAEKGMEYLFNEVDALIIVSNEKLMSTHKKLNFLEVMKIGSDVLAQGTRAIIQIIKERGLINIDFNDVVFVMKDKGLAHIGIGKGSGDDMIADAVNSAIENPILENSITGAKSLLVNIAMGDIPADTFQVVIEEIQKHASEDVKFKFGVYNLDSDSDELEVTVIATELENGNLKKLKKDEDKIAFIDPTISNLEEDETTEVDGEKTTDNGTKITEKKDDSSPFLDNLLEKDADFSNNKDKKLSSSSTGRTAGNWPFNQSNISDGPFDIPDFLNTDKND